MRESQTIMKTKSEKVAMTGMLLALGILLPFATAHGFGVPGNVLLPMHIPVFFCAFLCGPFYGALCGLLLPILNSVLTGMPPMYPMMPIMACELLTYGAVGGLLYGKTKLGKMRFGIYPSLLGAMVCGRVVYGLVFQALLLISGELKALTVWSAIVTGLPGIVVQLLLIPSVLLFLRGRRGNRRSAVSSAINLISEGTAVCVVIKGNTIVKTEHGRGIGPTLKLYDSGVLEGAFVVDKIIGKAAAMILTLGGVKGCYGVTMSAAAVKWLKEHRVHVEYENCVDAIMNRKGDGICPMELTVQEIEEPEEALEAVRNKLAELQRAE
ncbi:MAG: ECF transporter S component [Lachnospiraceae bacterium]